MAHQRRQFDYQVSARAAALSPAARDALVDLLDSLNILAACHADESDRRHKDAMHAYWKVVGVYCRHFRRLIRKSGLV